MSAEARTSAPIIILPGQLPGVLLLEPRVFGDLRGFFFESYNRRTMASVGITVEFVQDNHSRSAKNVVRGLHYQIVQPQGKLVRTIAGEIFDVAVDLRSGSASFGQAAWAHLSAENKRMVWIPPGFAHGFMVISDVAEVLYKTTDFYAPEHERTLLWNDPAVRIPWPVEGRPIVSPKDAQGKPLKEADLF